MWTHSIDEDGSLGVGSRGIVLVGDELDLVPLALLQTQGCVQDGLLGSWIHLEHLFVAQHDIVIVGFGTRTVVIFGLTLNVTSENDENSVKKR